MTNCKDCGVELIKAERCRKCYQQNYWKINGHKYKESRKERYYNHDKEWKRKSGYHKIANKRLRLRAMNKIGGAKCVNCGCNLLEALEINMKEGGHNRKISVKNTPHLIVSERVDLSLFNVMCRPCNNLHYLGLKLGKEITQNWIIQYNPKSQTSV